MSDKLKTQTQFRLVLTKEGMDALAEAVEFVNEGFKGGSVSKSDLATYLFKNAKRLFNKTELIRVRNEFFNEREALNELIFQSEATGTLPDEIRKLLKEQYGLSINRNPKT